MAQRFAQGMAHGFVKTLYRKRRIMAAAIFTGVLLKSSLKHFMPEDFFFTYYAYETKKPYVIDAIKLLNHCKEDMGICPDTFKVTPFVSLTTEVCSAGFSAFGFSQSYVGIPASFFCDSIEELSQNHILMQGMKRRTRKQFEMVDPNELKLMTSLLLSEDAQKFAVARHLIYLQENWALYQVVIPPLFVIIGYLSMYNLPQLLFKLQSKPVALNKILGLILLSAVTTYFIYKFVSSALMRHIQVQTDLQAARISPEYAKGGIEMYSKFAQSGSALRILLGKKGELLYTDKGDMKEGLFPFFNNLAPCFSKRISNLETVLVSQAGNLHDINHDSSKIS